MLSHKRNRNSETKFDLQLLTDLNATSNGNQPLHLVNEMSFNVQQSHMLTRTKEVNAICNESRENSIELACSIYWSTELTVKGGAPQFFFFVCPQCSQMNLEWIFIYRKRAASSNGGALWGRCLTFRSLTPPLLCCMQKLSHGQNKMRYNQHLGLIVFDCS